MPSRPTTLLSLCPLTIASSALPSMTDGLGLQTPVAVVSSSGPGFPLGTGPACRAGVPDASGSAPALSSVHA